MGFPVAASFGFRERQHLFGKNFGLLMIGEMSGAVDRFEAGARNHSAISAAVSLAEHAVESAPQKQRRKTNTVQPAFEPRIMKVRIPGKPRRRLARPRGGEHLAVRECFVIAFTDV